MNNDNKNQEYNSSICYTVTFNFFFCYFFAREWLNSKLVAYIFGGGAVIRYNVIEYMVIKYMFFS